MTSSSSWPSSSPWWHRHPHQPAREGQRILFPRRARAALVAHRLLADRGQHLDRAVRRHVRQRGRSLGLAIASYEWLAAITLVVVAFFFLPVFPARRHLHHPGVPGAALQPRHPLAHGAVHGADLRVARGGGDLLRGADDPDRVRGQAALRAMPMNLVTGSWLIGLMAAAYVASGGLKACAWADLIQGSALIVGGGRHHVFRAGPAGRDAGGGAGFQRADARDAGGLTPGGAGQVRRAQRAQAPHGPAEHRPVLPWTALLLGLWIPNFYYWGLNQYIMQRTLGSQVAGARPERHRVRRRHEAAHPVHHRDARA